MNTFKLILLPLFVLLSLYTKAQTEFAKGWLLNAKLTNGAISNFSGTAPDMYAGGLLLNPQITVVPGVLRLGANAGAVYADKKFSGLFGPMAALRIKTFGTENMGSYANLHLIAEANWGTNKQRMAGGGFAIEVLPFGQVGITLQRDYRLNTWWLQSFIAIKLNKIKHKEDEYSR